jgi:hypothetical protein
MLLILPFLRIRSELLYIIYLMVLVGEFMGKKSGEEQEGSFEEDMRAFFDSAVFEPKPKRKRKSRERKYRRGRKGKKDAKEDKEIPAPVSEDLGAFFGNDIPEGQEDSKPDEKDGKKEKEDIEENLRGFFREGMFEDQIMPKDEEKAQSFMCPHCGNRLGMAVDECECGATRSSWTNWHWTKKTRWKTRNLRPKRQRLLSRLSLWRKKRSKRH